MGGIREGQLALLAGGAVGIGQQVADRDVAVGHAEPDAQRQH